MQSYGSFVNVDGDGLGGLKTAPARYESSVIALLKHVSRFKVGWHVLNAIKKTGKKVLIRPAGSDGDMAAGDIIVMMPEQPYTVNLLCQLADHVGECPTEMRDRPHAMAFHRFGDVFIYFNPDHRVKPFLPRVMLHGLCGRYIEALFPYHRDDRWKAEDLLVHELFHALRILDVPNLFDLPHRRLEGAFVHVEELYAILIANMYRSEQRRDHELRGSWSRTFEVLRADDLAIRLQYGLHLDRLETQMPDLTSKLRTLPVNFNPFRVQL